MARFWTHLHKESMHNANYKLAGWALCLASLFFLAKVGKLDLLIVLVPLSALVTILSAGFNRGKGNADGNGKGLA